MQTIQEKELNEQLSKALDSVTTKLRQTILEGFKASMIARTATYLEDGMKFQTFESYGLAEDKFGVGTYVKVNEKRGYRMMVSDLQSRKLVVPAGSAPRTLPKKESERSFYIEKEFRVYAKAVDFDARLDKQANEYADDQLAAFKAKMIRKLNAIDVLTKATFSGFLDDNYLALEYKNGSFFLTTKVVYKRSILGTDFVQYPTTFHNAVVNGQPVKTPSEAKVKKAFKLVRGADFKETVIFKIQEIIPTMGFRSGRGEKTMTRQSFCGESEARAAFKDFQFTYKRATLLLVKVSDTEKTVLETRKQEQVSK